MDRGKYGKKPAMASKQPSANRPPPMDGELPKTAWVLHSGDTHVTNDRSLLVGARDCNESLYSIAGGEPMQALAIGEVYLELQNNLTLRLKRVRYAPNALCNLVSQTMLTGEMKFGLEMGNRKLYLSFKEESGDRTRFEAGRLVVLYVFLTKQPPIEYVIEYVEAHPMMAGYCLSTFTQDSAIGKACRKG